jgi:hypothetical protein
VRGVRAGRERVRASREMVADYRGGMSLDDVGAKYGIAQATAWLRLTNAGVQMRRRGGRGGGAR